ncbi:hypothetical protein LPJ61_000388 [Coemansia biformis]|uniref:SRR1-like domain-containing protein n=1 Tax=Coemansia biformis TaxID=1286918 RepID=A0A9W8D135_9FUNG|nr:hypothetical protein LPJ61_000388 [Coemansia biformis]
MMSTDADGFTVKRGDVEREAGRKTRAVAEKKAALSKSAFYTELCAAGLGVLQEFAPEEIVCYGLGSLSIDVSQWQLALIVLLNETLGAAMLAFDPAAVASDIAVLSKFGISTIAENEQAKRRAERRTLFFMPHCEQFLYENVVASNWPCEQLAKVAIVGNRLSHYGDVLTSADFADKLPHVRRVLPAIRSTAFPDERHLGLRHRPYAFTDTCIQRFDTAHVLRIAE